MPAPISFGSFLSIGEISSGVMRVTSRRHLPAYVRPATRTSSPTGTVPPLPAAVLAGAAGNLLTPVGLFDHRRTASVRRLQAAVHQSAGTRGPAFQKRKNMGLIITLIVGGIIGWLASIVMRTDAQQGIILNVVVGIVGAFLGSFLGSFFGYGASLSTFDPVGLLWAFIGAVVLLGIINLIRRGSVR